MSIKTAIVYRTEAQKVVDEFEKINYNDSDQVQFELCVFSDGRVAQRWLVGKGSCVWWDSCSHFNFGDLDAEGNHDSYLHVCGAQYYRNHVELMLYLYKLAFEEMGREPYDDDERYENTYQLTTYKT